MTVKIVKGVERDIQYNINQAIEVIEATGNVVSDIKLLSAGFKDVNDGLHVLAMIMHDTP